MTRILALAAASVFLLPASCREQGRPDPEIRMAVSHSREDTSEGSQPTPRVPTRVEIPPEVQKLYSGIRLAWKDAASGKQGSLDVPLGATARVPGSKLEVRGDAYLPSFTMTAEAITSSGTREENPAARIAVAENESEIFGGWIFKRFPEVHPFQHARFSLTLEGGVRRSSP